ncbi:hypothetical protein C8Q78DRAFT_1047436 [Trametes maxima]|nr:hypothetical protein C8Q78DRAFT_1047436 [Trametes maxima]
MARQSPAQRAHIMSNIASILEHGSNKENTAPISSSSKAKKDSHRARLAALDPIIDLDKLVKGDLVLSQIKDQLCWHRTFVDTEKTKRIPKEKDIPRKEHKIDALVAAVQYYLELPPDQRPNPRALLMPVQPNATEGGGEEWWASDDDEDE